MDEVRWWASTAWSTPPRKVTVARLTDDYRHMMLLSGEFINTPTAATTGSRGWLGHLTADGRPVAVEDLVNTVMNQGFQHYPIVAGDVEAEMRGHGLAGRRPAAADPPTAAICRPPPGIEEEEPCASDLSAWA